MEHFSIKFFGDLSPARRYEKLLVDNGAKIFSSIQEDISRADISFVNLESPLCDSRAPSKKTGPSLRGGVECARVLSEVGFDIIGLANNHIMDFGEEGLLETIEACGRYDIEYCGAGVNLSAASKPVIINCKGIKVGILAAAESEFGIATKDTAGAASLDPISMAERIAGAKKNCDILFVTIHCGNEYFEYPRPGLRRLCKFMIEQGADGVVGHHTHVSGVYEFHNGKPIFYSLGNFLFDHPNPPEGWNTGFSVSFRYDVSNKALLSYEIVPHIQSVALGGVRKLQGVELENFFSEMKKKKEVLKDEDKYEEKWNDYCDSKIPDMLLSQYFPFRFKGIGRLNKLISLYRFVLGRSSLRTKLNTVRCESHHELLVSILTRLLKKYGK